MTLAQNPLGRAAQAARPFPEMKKVYPGDLTGANLRGILRVVWGAGAELTVAPLLVKFYMFYVNRSVPAGRLTRCWSKDNRQSDDHDPRNDIDRNLLQLSLVHWHSPPF